MYRFGIAVVASVLMVSAVTNAQEKTVMVGGAAMYPSKDIIDNAVNSKDHTTLVAAVKAAGLVDTLKGKGPFTVFAPTNAAFAKLPAGTVDTLVKPENKATLTKILTYHVVAGKWDAEALIDADQEGWRQVDHQDRQRRRARRVGQGRQGRHQRRKGRHRVGDDRRRQPVERRDSRRRHGVDAEVVG